MVRGGRARTWWVTSSRYMTAEGYSLQEGQGARIHNVPQAHTGTCTCGHHLEKAFQAGESMAVKTADADGTPTCWHAHLPSCLHARSPAGMRAFPPAHCMLALPPAALCPSFAHWPLPIRLPSALCPLPSALCPLPFAPCSVPCAP